MTPAKTMFQLEPLQLPHSESRVNHCCCVPEFTLPSIIESEMNPPDAQPLSSSTSEPRMCMRRNGDACETAQRDVPLTGSTARFSTERQQVWVALPPLT